MDRSPFVTIRCPACASTDVTARAAGQFTCRHCGSAFLYAPQPAAVPPPRMPAAVHVVATPHAGSGRGVLIAIAGVIALTSVCGGLALLRGVAPTMPSIPETPRVEAVGTTIPARPATPTITPTPTLAPTPQPAREPTPATPVAPSVATDDAPKLDEPVALTDYQRLQGCGCKGTPPVALYARGTGTTTMITGAGMTLRRNLDFVLDRGEPTPWQLPVDDTTAPASGYEVSNVPIAVGCRDDVVVIAAGAAVSAWSLGRRALLWSQPLPAPYGRFGGEGREFVLDCDALRVGKRDVTIGSGRSRVTFALADGSPG